MTLQMTISTTVQNKYIVVINQGSYSSNFSSHICNIFVTLSLNILRFLRLKNNDQFYM